MPRLRCADDAAAAGPRRSTGYRATSACTPSWLRWTSAAWTVWPHGIGGPPSHTGVTPGGLAREQRDQAAGLASRSVVARTTQAQVLPRVTRQARKICPDT